MSKIVCVYVNFFLFYYWFLYSSFLFLCVKKQNEKTSILDWPNFLNIEFIAEDKRNEFYDGAG
jgi:hypothetical protein